MMQKNLLSKNECFIIGFFFIILFNFHYLLFQEFGQYSNSNDFLFHFFRSQNKCEELSYYYNCGSYPVGYTVLSQFFSFNETSFFIFNLFLICFLIPLILKQLVKNNWIIPLYFACSFPFNVLYAGIFPQMFIALCFLCYLLFRGSQYKYIFVGIGIFSHNLGLPFFSIIVLFDFLADLLKEADFNFQQKQDYFYPILAFPILKQVALGERLIESFFKPMPFVFAWIGFKKLIQERMYFLLSILIITIAYAFIDIRTLLFSEIILIIPASIYLSKSRKSFKILLIILILFYWFFNLIYWINSSYSLFTGINFI